MGIGPALPARITAGEWAAGRRAPSAEIHDESAATLSPDSRNGSTAPAETATTVAAQPVSPPEAAGPKSGFMMASTDFPSPTSRNCGRGHQRKTAFRGSGGPHRPGLLLLALDSFSRHSCSVTEDSLRPPYLVPYGISGLLSAISSSRLYLATRSPRAGAPVLICPQPVPTARSAMKESSVSPERCEIMAV